MYDKNGKIAWGRILRPYCGGSEQFVFKSMNRRSCGCFLSRVVAAGSGEKYVETIRFGLNRERRSRMSLRNVPPESQSQDQKSDTPGYCPLCL